MVIFIMIIVVIVVVLIIGFLYCHMIVTSEPLKYNNKNCFSFVVGKNEQLPRHAVLHLLKSIGQKQQHNSPAHSCPVFYVTDLSSLNTNVCM